MLSRFVLIFLLQLTCQSQIDSDRRDVDFETNVSMVGIKEHPLIFNASDRMIRCVIDSSCAWELPPNVKQLEGSFGIRWDYRANPDKCRCDFPECTIYGDCCIGPLLKDNKQIELVQDSSWKCHHLQRHGPRSIHAYMMSRCPKGTENKTAALCAGNNEQAGTSREYLLELPIYSSKTGILYRNIYCALCHLESDDDFLKPQLQINCDVELSSKEWSEFQQISTYHVHDRTWTAQNTTCQLQVMQFDENQLNNTIPNIRYCLSNVTDYCPDVSPPNVTDRVRALCPTYGQYIKSNLDGRIYKNPHCFMCHGGRMEEENSEAKCLTDTTKKSGGALQPHGVGLTFLFDFNLGNGGKYVGYVMLCTASEVWDYVRRACHPALCGKDHILVKGACQPTSNGTTESEIYQSRGRTNADSGYSDEIKEDNQPILRVKHRNPKKGTKETSRNVSGNAGCFRILIHETEYTLLLPNKSIAINTSTGERLYLDENDYDVVNATTVSICAKYLHQAYQSRFSSVFYYLSVAAMGLSVAFLLLHLVLYLLLPKLRNLPALNLFCLALSLFISQFVFLIFITATQNQIFCVTVAVTIHYFFLSAFFWMSSMSWDIWQAFSGSGLMASHSGREKARDAFRKYSAVSWICPMIIVLTAVFFDFGLPPLLGDESALQSLRPLYGQTGLCWISQRLSLLTFFAVPVGILITANLVLFSLTARTIILQNRETRRVIGGNKDSKSNRNRNDEVRLRLYIKLAVIMGLTWILGFISGFLPWDWLWYAFVILNGLQGTFIFFAFDWKKKTLGLLKEKYWNFRKVSTLSGSSGANTNRTHSQTN